MGMFPGVTASNIPRLKRAWGLKEGKGERRMVAACHAAGISRRKRKKEEGVGVLQELLHQPFTQPGFPSSGESPPELGLFLSAGGAEQTASTRPRARAGIQMCSHGTDTH